MKNAEVSMSCWKGGSKMFVDSGGGGRLKNFRTGDVTNLEEGLL